MMGTMSLRHKPRGHMGELLRKAEGVGCIVSLRRSNHIMILTPNGEKVFTSNTTSDRRAWKNLRAQLRRCGVNL